jgi:site-specific DNA-methyltransferase (adenine-specific)
LTALLSRRSLYCSKTANGKYSVCEAFDSPQGNIRFKRTEHIWKNGRCAHCGASKDAYDRGGELESHAYAFIHTKKPEDIFNMKFDVIIGNPPYQLAGGGGGTNDSSIYPLFVEQAINLKPRFLVMVIPSRWLAGGRNLDAVRKRMLTGGHIREFVDYTQMSTAFPGVDFEGGVGYFLWDRDTPGPCRYTLVRGEETLPTIERRLDDYDIFVRDSRALAILQKVLMKREPTMEQVVSGDTPFGLPTNFADYSETKINGALTLYLTVRGRRTTGWVKDQSVKKNRQLIRHWKVLLPEAYGERGALPAMVLGPPIVARPNTVCTQTYLVAGPFKSKSAAFSVQSYIQSRFFRFLVSLRKISQHALRSTYSWVPITLSCGKLTTGVTVKPWTGMFMLRNCSSPETYFQAAFRVQSPWTVRNPDGKSPNEEQIIKEECYVFDFAPDRALQQITDYSCRLSVNESDPEKRVEEFIRFLPVLARRHFQTLSARPSG